MVRTTNVSIATPKATPYPICWIWPPPEPPPAKARTAKVPQIRGRELVDVIREWLDSEDPLRDGLHSRARLNRQVADGRNFLDGQGGSARLRGEILHRHPIRTHEA